MFAIVSGSPVGEDGRGGSKGGPFLLTPVAVMPVVDRRINPAREV